MASFTDPSVRKAFLFEDSDSDGEEYRSVGADVTVSKTTETISDVDESESDSDGEECKSGETKDIVVVSCVEETKCVEEPTVGPSFMFSDYQKVIDEKAKPAAVFIRKLYELLLDIGGTGMIFGSSVWKAYDGSYDPSMGDIDIAFKYREFIPDNHWEPAKPLIDGDFDAKLMSIITAVASEHSMDYTFKEVTYISGYETMHRSVHYMLVFKQDGSPDLKFDLHSTDNIKAYQNSMKDFDHSLLYISFEDCDLHLGSNVNDEKVSEVLGLVKSRILGASCFDKSVLDIGSYKRFCKACDHGFRFDLTADVEKNPAHLMVTNIWRDENLTDEMIVSGDVHPHLVEALEYVVSPKSYVKRIGNVVLTKFLTYLIANRVNQYHYVEHIYNTYPYYAMRRMVSRLRKYYLVMPEMLYEQVAKVGDSDEFEKYVRLVFGKCNRFKFNYTLFSKIITFAIDKFHLVKDLFTTIFKDLYHHITRCTFDRSDGFAYTMANLSSGHYTEDEVCKYIISRYCDNTQYNMKIWNVDNISQMLDYVKENAPDYYNETVERFRANAATAPGNSDHDRMMEIAKYLNSLSSAPVDLSYVPDYHHLEPRIGSGRNVDQIIKAIEVYLYWLRRVDMDSFLKNCSSYMRGSPTLSKHYERAFNHIDYYAEDFSEEEKSRAYEEISAMIKEFDSEKGTDEMFKAFHKCWIKVRAN